FEYVQPQQDADTGTIAFPPHTLAWCDQPVAVIDAQGGRSQYAYDACGQLTRHTDCSGRSQSWRHGAWGEVVEAVDALGQRTQWHHAMQHGALRLVGVQHPGNTAVRYRWTEAGRMAAVTHGTHDVLEATGEPAGTSTSTTITYRHDLWG
ncbi:RHS repeat protein, partial [Achromobacter xylosoxidans]|nr:RHS repeat protein [Achromobacter xylosoxidans]